MKHITKFINEANEGYAVVAILPGPAGNFKPVSTYTTQGIRYNDRHPGAGIGDSLEALFGVDFEDIIEYDFEQMPEREAEKWIETRTEELMNAAKRKYERHLYR